MQSYSYELHPRPPPISSIPTSCGRTLQPVAHLLWDSGYTTAVHLLWDNTAGHLASCGTTLQPVAHPSHKEVDKGLAWPARTSVNMDLGDSMQPWTGTSSAKSQLRPCCRAHSLASIEKGRQSAYSDECRVVRSGGDPVLLLDPLEVPAPDPFFDHSWIRFGSGPFTGFLIPPDPFLTTL